MPHEIAATLLSIGSAASLPSASSLLTASLSATHAPEIDAVRELIAPWMKPTGAARAIDAAATADVANGHFDAAASRPAGRVPRRRH